MVKTLPSNAGGAGSIPGQGAMIPHASWPMSNRNSIVMNSVKTLKMVHILKNLIKKKFWTITQILLDHNYKCHPDKAMPSITD